MGIELGVSHKQPRTSRFRWHIQSFVGYFIHLLHALWNHLTRPYAPVLLHGPPLLVDCEKEPQRYVDIYQAHASLRASLKRRDAADAEFEAQVMALLAPVNTRLAEMRRGSGESVPVAHDTGPDLPSAPQIFYGRDTELLALVDTFSQRRQARAALLGQAGAGKSALALTLLHRPEIVSKFGARRFFVPCDASENAADVFSRLASALGLTHRPGEDALLSALASSPHDSLIILDDFEQSTALNEFLAMLSAIPRVSLLLTLRGTQYPLSPVDMPFPVSLGPLSLPSARALFRDISDLPPVTDDDQDPFIDALLQRAGCLPLHVTLLAQRAQYEPLPFLLARCAEEGGV